MRGWGCAETRRSTTESHTPPIAGTVPVSDVSPAALPPVAANAVAAGAAGAAALPRGVFILPRLPGPSSVVSGSVQPEGKKKPGRKRGGMNAGLEFDAASKATRWRRWKAQGGQAVLDAIGATTTTGSYRVLNLAMSVLSYGCYFRGSTRRRCQSSLAFSSKPKSG